ncbi:hypothetical protein SPWS13_0644 [Shewanella putrefaciens]|nr:hypothetical protein SPWS13_0644 [Shewanella putrefaciens]
MIFLSRLCGGELLRMRDVENAIFLSRLCGGEHKISNGIQ